EAVRARGRAAAARAPPRLEGDLHHAPKGAIVTGRVALAGRGPARTLAAALRRDRGRAPAREAARRRPRRIPGRRSAGQDRWHEHGSQPRGAGPLSRPRGFRTCARPAWWNEGSWP